MSRLFIAILFLATALRAPAQGVDDLKLQLPGFATQGCLHTTRNKWASTNSSDGSAAWTEAVVNLTAQPERRLRVGVEARYMDGTELGYINLDNTGGLKPNTLLTLLKLGVSF